MERIVELFTELQKEFVAFVERTNLQLSTPRCDFDCTHCNRRSSRTENYEESRCSNGEAYTPDDDDDVDDDDDELFEQSEIQIREVIENYPANYPDPPQSNEGSIKNESTSPKFILPGRDEVPEEMTISEQSLNLEDDQNRNDDDAEAEKENEIEIEQPVQEDPTDPEWHSFHEGSSKKAASSIDKRTCPYCDKIFPFPYLVKRHEVVHTGSAPFRCLGCKRSFAYRSSLHKHKLECPDLALTCTQCGVQFSTPKKLKLHITQAHKTKPRAQTKPESPNPARKTKSLRCEVCRRMFTNNSALSKHMTVHSGSSRFECTECGKKYSYMERIKSHYRKNHPDVPFAHDD